MQYFHTDYVLLAHGETHSQPMRESHKWIRDFGNLVVVCRFHIFHFSFLLFQVWNQTKATKFKRFWSMNICTVWMRSHSFCMSVIDGHSDDGKSRLKRWQKNNAKPYKNYYLSAHKTISTLTVRANERANDEKRKKNTKEKKFKNTENSTSNSNARVLKLSQMHTIISHISFPTTHTHTHEKTEEMKERKKNTQNRVPRNEEKKNRNTLALNRAALYSGLQF